MRLARICALSLLLGFTLGCGSDEPEVPDFGGEEGGEVATLIDKMNDIGTRPRELKAAFASGTTVSSTELRRYAKYEYTLKPATTVTVNGATATAAVVVDHNGTQVEKEWTFAKEGDRWKLKAAPLP